MNDLRMRVRPATITYMTTQRTNREICQEAAAAVAAALETITVSYEKNTYKNKHGMRTDWLVCIPQELINDAFFCDRIPAFSSRKAAIAGWEQWKSEAATDAYASNFVLHGIDSAWFNQITNTNN